MEEMRFVPSVARRTSMDTHVQQRPLEPWDLDPDAFPEDGTVADKLAYLVGYAVLAPSGHNTQPWRFRMRGDVLELWADRTRRLPVVDPDDRALIISCGAATFHLRVAAQAHDLPVRVETLPDGDEADLVARVWLEDGEVPVPDARRLAAAIPLRRTDRARFEERELPGPVLEELQRDVAAEGAHLSIIGDEPMKRRLAQLVAEGDRRQMADRRFRRELAMWVRANTSPRADGVRGHGFGFSDLVSHLGPLVIRTFDLGNSQAAKDEQIAQGSPILAVVSTADDDAGSWVSAGQGLARMLLRARDRGVSASFLNQPVEVAELRTELADVLGLQGPPQLLLRLGYGSMPPPQPRRPVDEVLSR
jgi:nitroreductase